LHPQEYSLSIVVPVFNSESSLRSLITRLERVMAQEGWLAEIILVNDGSVDGSWEQIRRLSAGCAWVHGINLMRNYGQHNALLCGIRAARHDVVVTMDDDLQHPPEEIPRLLARLAEGWDVVYGKPLRERSGPWRGLASKFARLALRGSMGGKMARQASAFRAFRTELRGAFADYQSPFVSIDVLLTWATMRFDAVGVRHDPRRIGKSNYTFRKLLVHAFNMITGSSTRPLEAISLMGIGFTIFGFLALAGLLLRYLIEGGRVPAFLFLASLIAIFSGAQMFALGIVGEYLARAHFRLMDRPAYAVREETVASLPEPPMGTPARSGA
jgi:glycosyltransferase involved in cell wall biosynthesis